MLKRFIIYGLIGWSMEIIWTGSGSFFLSKDITLHAYTNLWMFFIYGSAVFLEPVHDVISGWRWPLRGVIWVVIIWGMEYTSGILMTYLLGINPWTYTGPFAIDGIVRVDYAPAWFIAGLIFERIHHSLDRFGIA